MSKSWLSSISIVAISQIINTLVCVLFSPLYQDLEGLEDKSSLPIIAESSMICPAAFGTQKAFSQPTDAFQKMYSVTQCHVGARQTQEVFRQA